MVSDEYYNRDYDIPDYTHLRSGISTARKKHKCDCGKIINPGIKYEYNIGILDGEFTISKRCHSMSCIVEPEDPWSPEHK